MTVTYQDHYTTHTFTMTITPRHDRGVRAITGSSVW